MCVCVCVCVVIDDLARKQQACMSSDSSSSCPPDSQSSSAAASPTIPAASPTIPAANAVLLKGRDGRVVAKGTVYPERDVIHGHPRKKECQIVCVGEVVQSGAQMWFEDWNHEELLEGMFVEWPKSMLLESNKQCI